MSRMPALFTAHPASVGETYLQHLASAWGFALRMGFGAVVCLVHGLLPFLFRQTGSRTIATLHDRMIVNRSRLTPARRPVPPRSQGDRTAGAADFFSSPG